MHPDSIEGHSEVLLVFCTCPDEKTAAKIAEALVVERLAACVNRLPGLTSAYLWQGKVERDTETLLLIKTTNARFEALRMRLCALHPYELPEVIAIPVTKGLPAYLRWVTACTSVDV
ncbi:divalent-cation tolerance protein CutA [Candidatus Thiosymbion oneisti]|uniref:divalent-cation tolerance protein CutA n=1 Tax=Candidatus Thiosymbion oneisti TaxID=589554 RepID=UPI000A80A181|nr:divalent-cation tolerance protein CutA [Candidatus Thiosymbion oneisti]